MLSHRGHDHAWVYKFIVIFRCLILGCSVAYDPHIAKEQIPIQEVTREKGQQCFYVFMVIILMEKLWPTIWWLILLNSSRVRFRIILRVAK